MTHSMRQSNPGERDLEKQPEVSAISECPGTAGFSQKPAGQSGAEISRGRMCQHAAADAQTLPVYQRMRTPGILLAAPSSGSGKTAAACALMAAYKASGVTVRACKCGPDYIDPMFHREVLGVDSVNLDLFFSSGEMLRDLYDRHGDGADLVITEGVMGYYDGMSMDTDCGSSYDVARTLNLPVLLVLPARGAALSLAAVASGMIRYRSDSRICGILLNQVSEMTYPRIKDMLERELSVMGNEIPVVGYLPKADAFAIGSRHLGLVTPEELEGLKNQLKEAGEILARTVDLERIRRIAEEACARIPGAPCEIPDRKAVARVRIGIARDRAFCFYYKENRNLLERLGCELVYFSPLEDSALPEGVDGLLLGGGYPELYAKELSANQSMLQSVRRAAEQGMPLLAECGGFMYLHEAIEDQEGRSWQMAGVIAGTSFPTGRLGRFGYISIENEGDSQEDASEENPSEQRSRSGYLRQGETIRGHEFHYWDSTDSGSDCIARKPDGRRNWLCIYDRGNMFAGYPHLYYPSLPEFAERFVQRCRTFAAERSGE